MKKKYLFLLAASFFLLSSLSAQNDPASCADPLVGTSNSRWMLGPYACVPFGMVQLGPDNQGDGWMFRT
jgi:putative alpha-1,2-mannosidase